MQYIQYNDTCVIKRLSAEKDEWDNETSYTEIYAGKCNYQKGGQTSLSIVTRNDVVYLPSNDVQINQDDIVDVTTNKGRKASGVVNVVRDIELPISHEQFTKLELKQVTDK
jgi:hypothetical protein